MRANCMRPAQNRERRGGGVVTRELGGPTLQRTLFCCEMNIEFSVLNTNQVGRRGVAFEIGKSTVFLL
jgi:hypothetical protein